MQKYAIILAPQPAASCEKPAENAAQREKGRFWMDTS